MIAFPVPGVSARDIESWVSKGYTWWKAKRLLIVGQERAGKTRLFEYMNSRVLQKENDFSPITTGEVKLWLKKFSFARDGIETSVDLLSMMDQSGQAGPYIHADLVRKYRPQIMFIVLDLSCPLHSNKPHEASITWFNEFSKKLAEHFRSSRRLAKSISSVTVLLNKFDLNDREKFRQAESEIKSAITTLWAPYIGTKADRIVVRPSCTISRDEAGDVSTKSDLDMMLINAVNNSLLRVQ
jgi:hypothetical protein